MDLLIRNVFSLDNPTDNTEKEKENIDDGKREQMRMKRSEIENENEVREEEEDRFVMRIDHANAHQQHDNIHYYHDISLSPNTFGYMFM